MRNILKTVGNLFIISLIVAILVSLAFVAGYISSMGYTPSATVLQAIATPTAQPDQTSEPSREEQFGLFWEAWDLLESDFYGEMPNYRDAARAAIKGLLQKLGDPNTTLLEPELAKVFNEDMSGEFEGIGASVRTDENGYFTIVQPFEGSPASQAGLKPGDIVLEVDDQPVQGLSTTEVISMIRGPKGTTVKLLIYRPSTQEKMLISVVRARIEIPTIEARFYDSVAYIHLRDFNALAARQFHETLRALLTQKPAGIVLDLRGNPGGLLDVAIRIASEFVGEGVITEERFRDGTGKLYPALRGGLATDPTLPVVVLVNQASASASEIVAGAIQDTGRGILVGEPTFGKGSVQVAYTLSDESQLRITVAHWFTPNGRDINQEGLQPDIEVPFSWEEYTAGKDAQLEKALEVIRSSKRL